MRLRLCVLTLLPLFFCYPAFTQQSVPHSQPEANQPFDDDEARSRIARDMEKKAAKQRVAALKTDTDRLLKLSLELKEYVDKSDENVLSLDVIKKAEAIEKLAKRLKTLAKG